MYLKSHNEGYNFIDATELSIKYLDNSDQIKVYLCLLNLVADGICVTDDLDTDKFRLADKPSDLREVF